MKYYLKKRAQPNGDYKLHNENYRYLPSSANQKYLDDFSGFGTR